jgi:ligand-binding sensor domain-containing protein
LWIGTNGSGIRFDDRSQDYLLPVPGASNVHTAVALDSSGYIWLDNGYSSADTVHFSLEVQQPAAGYPGASARTGLFYEGSQYYLDNILSMNVDHNGTIYCGALSGELLILRHNGNPLQGQSALTDIQMLKHGFGRIWSIDALSDGTTVIGADNGLFLINPYTGRYEVVQNIGFSIRAVAAAPDGTLWLGSSRGILRIKTPLEYQAGTTLYSMTSAVADTIRYEAIYYTEEQGLIDNAVTTLALQPTGGYLWAGTTAGISRFTTGVATQTIDSLNTTVRVWPNPLRRNRDNACIFEHIAPQSHIAIYSTGGTLVGTALPIEDNSTIYTWSISPSTVPGTYVYIISPGKTFGKIMVLP